MKTTKIECVTMAELKVSLAALIAEHGNKYHAAKVMGISHSMLGQVMSGFANPGRKVLNHFGLQELRVYVPKTKTDSYTGSR